MNQLTPSFSYWCRSRDLNPDGCCPLPPQDSVSTKFHHFGIPVRPGIAASRYPADVAGNLPVSNGFVNIKRAPGLCAHTTYFAVCGAAGA
jgi:hypothetical protein